MKKLLMVLAFLPLMAAAETWYDVTTGLTWEYCLDGGATMKRQVPVEYGALPPGATIEQVSPAPVGALEIPSSVNGHDVVAIDQNFLKQCETITSVSVPATVREISCYAFYDCKNLREIRLSEGLELIAWKAFNRFKGASVTLPSTLSVLFTAVLTDASVSQTVTFLGGVPKIVETHGDTLAFEGRPNLMVLVPRQKGWDEIVSRGTWQGSQIHYSGTGPQVGSLELLPGEAVSFDTGLVGYTAKGLPSGLKYNKKTVQIAVTAKSGAVEKKDIAIHVDPLPDWAVGTFEGAVRQIDYDADGNVVSDGEGLHDWYDIVATVSVDAKGKISGKLTFPDKKTLAMKLNALTAVEPGICIAEGDVTVKKQRYAVRAVFGAGSFQFADGVVNMGRCDLSIIMQGQPTTCFRTDADRPLVQTFWSRKELKGLALQMGLTAKSGFDVENATGEDSEFSGVVKVSDRGVAKLSCTVNGTKSTANGTLLPVGQDLADGFAAYVSIKISRTSFRAVKLLFVPTAEGWVVRVVRWL